MHSTSKPTRSSKPDPGAATTSDPRVEAVVDLLTLFPDPNLEDDPTESEMHLRWRWLSPDAVVAAVSDRWAALTRVADRFASLSVRVDNEVIWHSDELLGAGPQIDADGFASALRDAVSNESREDLPEGRLDARRTAELTVELTVVRGPIARALVPPPVEGVTVVPVVSTQTVLRLLAAIGLEAPQHWKALGVDYEGATLFVGLLPGPELRTQLVEVVPRHRLASGLEHVRAAADSLEAARRCRTSRPEVARLFPVAVTPFHLWIVDREAHASSVAAIVDTCDRVAAQLALCFLAKEMALPPETDRPRWVFLGHRRSEARPDGVSSPDSAASETAAVDALCTLVEWVYERRADDKLELLQGLISLHLGGGEGDNYRTLLRTAPQLVVSARSAWKTYVQGAISQFFENQRELGAVAAGKVQRYSESLATLVKGIAAYGVTLLAFLFTQVLVEQKPEALIDQRQMVEIFLIYSGVVLVTLFGYTLSEEWLLRRELSQSLHRLGQYHDRMELDRYLSGPLRVRRRQFYAFLVVLLLLSVLAVCWVLTAFT